MTVEKYLPVVMITLSLLASLVYGIKGDVRHCLYWAFAAGITVVVTF
jgi:hypothetical protein